jgi:hypothetical protein
MCFEVLLAESCVLHRDWHNHVSIESGITFLKSPSGMFEPTIFKRKIEQWKLHLFFLVLAFFILFVLD